MAENRNAYVQNYKKEHYKRVPLEVKREYYDEVLAPAASLRGMTVNSFIKEAIAEKLDREKNKYSI